MRIEVTQFGGIRPSVTPVLLGAGEAQTAQNCKIRGGGLTALASDLPTATAPTFSYVDDFGTWTLSGGRLCLNNVAVNQTAPNAPTISTSSMVANNEFAIDVHSTTANGKTITHSAQITTRDDNGDSIIIGTTVNPGIIPSSNTSTDYGSITGVSRIAKIKVGDKVFQNSGDEGQVGGGMGMLRLDSVTLSPVTVTWKKASDDNYYLYVSVWTATFLFRVRTDTDAGEARAIVYRMTTVEDNGMESPASDPSNMALVKAGEFPKLTGLTTDKKKRIYRASGNVIKAQYFFVAEVGKSNNSFTDSVADCDLGDEMPEIENPPAMTQVVWMAGGFLAGFSGNNVYFSESDRLYNWNSDNALTVQNTIKGIITSGNDLIVLTDAPGSADDTNAKNYAVTGVSPDAMSMSELMVNQSCSSRNSICKVGSTIGFASPEGFVLIIGGTGKVITEPFYTRTQWAALTPANMTCKEYDNQVVIFTSSTAGLILDYNNGTMRTFAAGGAGSFVWQSKVYEFPEPVELHVAQVAGDSGSHTLTIYGDGATAFNGTITVGTDLRLTRTATAAKRWEFKISGITLVNRVTLIHRERIEVNGPMSLTKAQVEGSWRGLLFKFPVFGRFKVIRARAGAYNVTAAFYRDATLDSTNTVTNDSEVRLTQQTDGDLWEVDITATGEVYELMLVPRVVRVVDGPIVLRNLQHLRGHLFHFPNAGSFKVGRVRGADGGAVGNLVFYVDEAASATLTQAVSTDADFRITGVNAAELVEVEFVPTDQTIQIDEILLIPRTVQTVNGPVVLSKAGRMSWKGTVVQFPRSGTFKVYRARGRAGSVTATLNLYADEAGAATKTVSIATDADARIESLSPSDTWEIEVIPTGELDEFILWPQAEQETNSPVIHVARGAAQGPATWLAQEFRYPEPVRMRTAIVKAKAYPVTLTIYCDGAQVGGSPFTVADAKEFRLNVPSAIGRVWEFDASVANVIDSVTLFAETVQDVDMAAFYLKYDGVKGNVSTLARVMRFRRDECFNCAKVEASAYPVTLKLYRAYAKTPTYTAQVLDSSGFRLPKMQPARTWEIDAIPKDTATIIHSVALAKSMAMLRA